MSSKDSLKYIKSGDLIKYFDSIKYSRQELILLKYRFEDNENKNRDGLVTPDEYRTENNRIIKSLIQVSGIDKAGSSVNNFGYGNHQEFSLFKGADVPAYEILKSRSNPNFGFKMNFYIQREYLDLEITNIIKSGHNLIVYGKPLSGKTRAVYELIKNDAKERDIYIVQNMDDLSSIDFLKNISDRNAVVLFDDLSDNINSENKINYLRNVFENYNIQIICTANIRSERKIIESFGKKLETFKSVKIQSYTKLQAQNDGIFQERSTIINDNTIGSYFLPIQEMTARYTGLDEKSREVLRCYKVINFWSRTLTGDYDMLVRYSKKRIKNAKTSKIRKIISNLELQGFIQIDDFKVYVPDSYLNEFITYGNDYRGSKTLIREIVTFFPNSETCSRLFPKLSNKSEIDYLSKLMVERGLKYDIYSYNFFISISNSFDGALSIYNNIVQDKSVVPDVISINILMKKAQSSSEVEIVLAKAKESEIEIDDITKTTIISKIPSVSEAVTKLEELVRQDNYLPTSFTFRALINMAVNHDEVIVILKKFKSYSLEVDNSIFGLSISKVSNENELRNILVHYSEKIEFKTTFFNRIINLIVKRNFTSTDILEAVKYAGGDLDVYGLNTLLNHCKDEKELLKIYSEIKHPNVVTFSILINKSKDYSGAYGYYCEMDKNLISPNTITLNALLSKVSNLQQIFEVLEIFAANELNISIVSLKYLLENIRNKSSLLIVKNFIISKFLVDPREMEFLIMIDNIKDNNIEAAKGNLLNYVKESGEISYPLLFQILASTNNLDDCLNLFNFIPELGLDPINPVIFNIVLQKTRKIGEGLRIVSLMNDYDCQPNIYHYTTIMSKSKSKSEADIVLNEIFYRSNTKPNEITMSVYNKKKSGIKK